MTTSHRLRFVPALFVAVAAAALVQAPAAAAYSGSITNVHNVSGTQYEATYTSSFDKCSSSYCGWFPEAWQVQATEPCAAQGSHPVYVGSSQSASGSLTESDTFYAAFTVPTKLCLYAYQASTWTFLAETTFTPSASGSPGTPPPSGSGDGVATGSIADAHSVAGGKASATFTTTVTQCPSSGSCLWYPSAYQLPAAQTCPDTSATLTHIMYVGDSHTGTGTVTGTETFPPIRDEPHLRLCLYVSLSGSTKQLIAQTLFTPTATGSMSGSITNVHSLASGKVQATFSLDVTRCLADRTCSWSGRAYRLPATRRCTPDGGEWVWLGNYHSTSSRETKTVSFAPRYTRSIRLCLYVRQNRTERLVDQTTYTVPKPKPFSLTRAKSAVNQALQRRFGAPFMFRSHYSRSCRRISSKRVTCSVSWSYIRDTYRGTVTVWVDSLPWTHIHYRLTILRRHPL